MEANVRRTVTIVIDKQLIVGVVYTSKLYSAVVQLQSLV
jgi:hypothetical protein